jgi:hypothetical protein
MSTSINVNPDLVPEAKAHEQTARRLAVDKDQMKTLINTTFPAVHDAISNILGAVQNWNNGTDDPAADLYDPSVLAAWKACDPPLQSELSVTCDALEELRTKLADALGIIESVDVTGGVTITQSVTASPKLTGSPTTPSPITGSPK